MRKEASGGCPRLSLLDREWESFPQWFPRATPKHCGSLPPEHLRGLHVPTTCKVRGTILETWMVCEFWMEAFRNENHHMTDSPSLSRVSSNIQGTPGSARWRRAASNL